jgi:hypothetical protein
MGYFNTYIFSMNWIILRLICYAHPFSFSFPFSFFSFAFFFFLVSFFFFSFYGYTVLVSLLFTSLTISAHSHLSSASFLHCLIPIFLKSLTSSSRHFILCLPMFLFHWGLPPRAVCGTLLLLILIICPSHSVLLGLISASSFLVVLFWVQLRTYS